MKSTQIKNTLLKAFFFSLVFALGFSAEIFAQAKCDLPVRFVDRENNDEAVADVNATAVNQQTKKTYKVVWKKGKASFKKLPEGNYKFTIEKIGYKKIVASHEVLCSTFIPGGLPFPLLRGDSKSTTSIAAMPVKKEGEKIVVADLPSRNIDIPSLPKPQISGGVVNGKALRLVKPEYPQEAKENRDSGVVEIQVLIDEKGDVLSAKAKSGAESLRESCEKAAMQSKFSPFVLNGKPVVAIGTIVYNFTL